MLLRLSLKCASILKNILPVINTRNAKKNLNGKKLREDGHDRDSALEVASGPVQRAFFTANAATRRRSGTYPASG
jgi:hypothetical protein